MDHPHPSSDKLFEILWNKYDNLSRELELLFERSLKSSDSRYRVSDLFRKIKRWIEDGKRDHYIFEELYQILQNPSKSKESKDDNGVYNTNVMSESDIIIRSQFRANEIYNIIDAHLTEEEKKSLDSYVDIGSAEGSITAGLGSKLNIEPLNIHACDVTQLSFTPTKFQFHKITPLHSLPFANNSISIATAIMSLHHICDASLLIVNNIFNILKPGGFFVIREHDSSPRGYDVLLDVMHGLYSLSLSHPKEDPEWIKNFRSKYFSREAWRKVVEYVGFRVITLDDFSRVTKKGFNRYTEVLYKPKSPEEPPRKMDHYKRGEYYSNNYQNNRRDNNKMKRKSYDDQHDRHDYKKRRYSDHNNRRRDNYN
eukprot:TRINITY_DN284_c0_g1_i21.p1 TRINITY_DN284_c0_g1~~TRINITY_DN284_c0_g1_i21.p1  ORF type:complete len:368 (-),score=65.43 TRINITY_DN284_c0_g1_i21:19-1122(-)